MSDILLGRQQGLKTLHTWTRYRAHLHVIDIKRGPVIVPLDRIHSQFEYLEEVRFERFVESNTQRGLLNYIWEYWNLKYDTELNCNDTHIVHELYKQTGIFPLPVVRQERHYQVLGKHFTPWQEYFPSYVVGGIRVDGIRKIFYSPYADEIESLTGYTVERVAPLKPGSKPRVKIIAKV